MAVDYICFLGSLHDWVYRGACRGCFVGCAGDESGFWDFDARFALVQYRSEAEESNFGDNNHNEISTRILSILDQDMTINPAWD